MPRSPYRGTIFGSFHVAEPDSNRPAHSARLLRVLRREGRPREDAEDLTQEAKSREIRPVILAGIGSNSQLEAKKRFPCRIKLGLRAVGWIEGEVQVWLATRIERSCGSASDSSELKHK